MTIKTITHKAIFLTAIGLSVSACSKNDSKCENWQVWDECVPKNSTTICTNPPIPNYVTDRLCGDELDGISPGATKVVYEDANAKKVRHYVKRV